MHMLLKIPQAHMWNVAIGQKLRSDEKNNNESDINSCAKDKH